MNSTERARVEAFLRDLARVCVAHGMEIDGGQSLPALDLVFVRADGSASGIVDRPRTVIKVQVDASPPPVLDSQEQNCSARGIYNHVAETHTKERRGT